MRPQLIIIVLVATCAISSDFAGDITYEYQDYKHIEYRDINGIEDKSLLAYFYSETCLYCKEIKQAILKFASTREYIYLVTVKDREVLCRYNKGSEEDIYCISGTPTLMKIENNTPILTIAGAQKVLAYILENS